MSCFNYSDKEINGMIVASGLDEVAMQGVHRDLEKLKPLIEELYDKHIFYLTYFLSDAPYHGWDLQSEPMKNMSAITEGITKKFKEIYALVLAGLGEECESNDRPTS